MTRARQLIRKTFQERTTILMKDILGNRNPFIDIAAVLFETLMKINRVNILRTQEE